MDLEEMKRFKVRAMEIGRNSRNPVKCLRLMQFRVTSILGFDVVAGGRECCSPQFPIPLKGAMVSSAVGNQAGKTCVTDGEAEAAAEAILPAGVRFSDPAVVAPGVCHGEPAADAPVVQMDLGGPDNAIDVGSDVQGTTQFFATADLGTQQNEVKSCSVLLCVTDEKLSIFHGLVDWIT
jgi:hypothetical protein